MPTLPCGIKPLVLAGNNENVLFMTTPGTICCQTDTYGSLLFQFVVKNDSIESINISSVENKNNPVTLVM